jgi:tetratricopeptide (TPR) repeat protein
MYSGVALRSSMGCVLFIFFLACSLGFAQDPTTPQSTLDQADALLNQGKPGDALSLLTALAEKDPKTPGLQGKIGKAYFRSRQVSQAIEHLKAALQQDAGDRQSAQLLALSFYAQGKCREALPLLEKLGPQPVEGSPDTPNLASICYVMTEQWDKARTSMAQMFSLSPDSAMAYLMLGKLLVQQQMVDRALPEVETALRLDPRLTMAHFLLGEIDLYRSNPQAAVTEFQKELTVNPTMWLAYWRLGDGYVRLGNYEQAETVLKEAIWLNDTSVGAYFLLAEIALKKNDPALAAGFLERALGFEPQNIDAHAALANAYKALGREAEAKRESGIAQTLRSESHASEKDVLQSVP